MGCPASATRVRGSFAFIRSRPRPGRNGRDAFHDIASRRWYSASLALMSRQPVAVVWTALALAALVSVPAMAQDAPRTPWGAPDLQGVWDFRTITPMERPTGRSDQEFLTDEEAARLGQEAVERNTRLATRAARRTEVDPSGNVDRGVDGAPGSYNQFWFDRGTSVIASRRTSLVIDPPDGRIPPADPGGGSVAVRKWPRRARTTGSHEPTPGGWVDDLGPNGLQARCITGFNSGPPMTPGGYNNNFQLFQTPGYGRDLQRDEPQPAHRAARRAAACRPAPVGRRFARVLGRRHARGRDEGFSPGDQFHARRVDRGAAVDRALHA